MRIYGMMRVKNEARWIRKVIESQLPIVQALFILDDHSSDGTPDICRQYPQVTLLDSPFSDLREDRDKNWLLRRVEEVAAAGDHIICIDGDEEIAPGGIDIIRSLASREDGPDAYRFQVLYLWDSETQIRVDRLYKNFRRPSMFKLRAGAQFVSRCGGGFHCGNVPEPKTVSDSKVKLLHYGYMNREDRIRKWNFYNSNDPNNRAEGYDARFPERRTYPHIVQGDVPEVPSDAVLVHAGPLQLQPLSLGGAA